MLRVSFQAIFVSVSRSPFKSILLSLILLHLSHQPPHHPSSQIQSIRSKTSVQFLDSHPWLEHERCSSRQATYSMTTPFHPVSSMQTGYSVSSRCGFPNREYGRLDGCNSNATIRIFVSRAWALSGKGYLQKLQQ